MSEEDRSAWAQIHAQLEVMQREGQQMREQQSAMARDIQMLVVEKAQEKAVRAATAAERALQHGLPGRMVNVEGRLDVLERAGSTVDRVMSHRMFPMVLLTFIAVAGLLSGALRGPEIVEALADRVLRDSPVDQRILED